uniref:Uncharacterized protein n=1 Tax=Glossina brevipalpis TaxID=37001 RepID=A0A1A9WG86_9MUSC
MSTKRFELNGNAVIVVLVAEFVFNAQMVLTTTNCELLSALQINDDEVDSFYDNGDEKDLFFIDLFTMALMTLISIFETNHIAAVVKNVIIVGLKLDFTLLKM